jgi:hypothetical protein
MLFLTGWIAAQDAAFSVSLSADTIGLNNRLEVTFTLTNARGSSFEPPVFEGFRQVSGPNVASQFSLVNGSMSSSVSYTYVLEPMDVGQYYIQPASIETDGRVLETKLAEVWVFPEWDAPDRLQPAPDRDFWFLDPPAQPETKPKKKRPITKM